MTAAKASAVVPAAESALEEAQLQLATARDRAAAAQQKLEQEDNDYAANLVRTDGRPPEPTELTEFVRRTKMLLDICESGEVAMAGSMPEALLASMAAVHEVVQTIEPMRPPTLDGPLEGGDGAGDLVGDGDEDMDTQAELLLQRLQEAQGADAMNIVRESVGNIAKGRGEAGSNSRFEPR